MTGTRQLSRTLLTYSCAGTDHTGCTATIEAEHSRSAKGPRDAGWTFRTHGGTKLWRCPACSQVVCRGGCGAAHTAPTLAELIAKETADGWALTVRERLGRGWYCETCQVTKRQLRGFAAMSKETRSGIASKGGAAAHAKGTAHEWTTDEARRAGRRGGLASRGGRGKAPTAMPGPA